METCWNSVVSDLNSQWACAKVVCLLYVMWLSLCCWKWLLFHFFLSFFLTYTPRKGEGWEWHGGRALAQHHTELPEIVSTYTQLLCDVTIPTNVHCYRKADFLRSLLNNITHSIIDSCVISNKQGPRFFLFKQSQITDKKIIKSLQSAFFPD